MPRRGLQWVLPVTACAALVWTESAATDPRIRNVRYSADAVVEITGHVGYATTVLFHPEEVVESVAVGDDAWHIAPEANRISLKPRGDGPYPDAGVEAFESDTNMTVWTDRRVYFFELKTSRSTATQDMTYAVRFLYPPEPGARSAGQAARRREAGRALLETGADAAVAGAEPRPAAAREVGAGRHWDYSWSGSAALRPVGAFDDGRFTYFRFEDGSPLPAIYIGEADGTESIANLHIREKWVVIHRLASRFVLRDGALVACVFREPGPAR